MQRRAVFPALAGSLLAIRVTAQNQENGYIATTAEYSNCRLHVEYKWGGKRFPPRLEARRDSGIMYFVVGEDRLFPTSAGCQLVEGDVGDLNIIGNASAIAGGGGRGGNAQTTRRVVKDANFEVLDGWNTIEIVLSGNAATQLVNGRIVSRASNLLHWDQATPEQTAPLDRGRVLLQAYGAEIWFRNLKWRPL